MVGALEASFRAVRAILVASWPEKLEEFEKQWGMRDDKDFFTEELILRQFAIAENALTKAN